jgi:DNA polymerase III epsilon subunit-like protein
MTTLVFIDTETTSLRHDRRAWEIAVIVRKPGDVDSEHSWFVDLDDLDLGNADLMSLKVGRFYDRHPDVKPIGDVDPFIDQCVRETYALEQVERLTRGAHLVGAVPNFDADVLGARMRACGICPSWHYHLVDVETLAAGHRGFRPPWGFDDILAAYGLEYDEADRHTALGDARMARDLYDAVLGGKP